MLSKIHNSSLDQYLFFTITPVRTDHKIQSLSRTGAVMPLVQGPILVTVAKLRLILKMIHSRILCRLGVVQLRCHLAARRKQELLLSLLMGRLVGAGQLTT